MQQAESTQQVPMYGGWPPGCVNRSSPARWPRATACLPNASCPHVSKSIAPTVLQAYQRLKDEGLIASKVGKGFVRAAGCLRKPNIAHVKRVTPGMQ